MGAVIVLEPNGTATIPVLRISFILLIKILRADDVKDPLGKSMFAFSNMPGMIQSTKIFFAHVPCPASPVPMKPSMVSTTGGDVTVPSA